jgi:acyl carrier protein
MRDRHDLREELIGFLNTVARPGCQVNRMDDDTNLIDAGVIDSLAAVQIILYIEQNYDVNLQSQRIDPNDLGTINGILAAITRSSE